MYRETKPVPVFVSEINPDDIEECTRIIPRFLEFIIPEGERNTDSQ